jgi:hypothetical protein
VNIRRVMVAIALPFFLPLWSMHRQVFVWRWNKLVGLPIREQEKRLRQLCPGACEECIQEHLVALEHFRQDWGA